MFPVVIAWAFRAWFNAAYCFFLKSLSRKIAEMKIARLPANSRPLVRSMPRISILLAK